MAIRLCAQLHPERQSWTLRVPGLGENVRGLRKLWRGRQQQGAVHTHDGIDRPNQAWQFRRGMSGTYTGNRRVPGTIHG